MDTARIREAAIEISTIADLYRQELERPIRGNLELKERKRTLEFMREKVIGITFQISKELKSLEKLEKI